jgi:hypothetical protein
LRPILKKYTCLGPGPMRDVYLDFRLPWPAKIAAGMLTPGKWWPFEIYLTTTWTDHIYLEFPSIKSNGFFTKNIFLCDNKVFLQNKISLEVIVLTVQCETQQFLQKLLKAAAGNLSVYLPFQALLSKKPSRTLYNISKPPFSLHKHIGLQISKSVQTTSNL